ncbi:MAG: tetratricopeptide repeat protein [Pyrinomonadaceae bacterium]|nr:tetratricopeptide repeat protein [Pyrinomonadaceae bacterium]
MKKLAIKIFFLCAFIYTAAISVTAQLLFEPPKEWAASVPQSVIDASPPPVMSGKPMPFSPWCKKSELCVTQADSASALEVGVTESANFQKPHYVPETPNFSTKKEDDVEGTIRFLIKSHQWQKALEASNKSIPRWYSSSTNYVNRAIIFYALGQRERALKDLDAAIHWANGNTKSSGYVLAYLQRGIIYARQGDGEKAKADYAALIAAPDYFWSNQPIMNGKSSLNDIIANKFADSSAENGKIAKSDAPQAASLEADLAYTGSDCGYDTSRLENAYKDAQKKRVAARVLAQIKYGCKDYQKASEYQGEYLIELMLIKIKGAELYRAEMFLAQILSDARKDGLSATWYNNALRDNAAAGYDLDDPENAIRKLAVAMEKAKAAQMLTQNEISRYNEEIAKARQYMANRWQFRICNGYSYDVKVSYIYPSATGIIQYTDGWRLLGPKKCTPYVTVMKDAMRLHSVFITGYDSRNSTYLSGDSSECFLTLNNNYKAEVPSSCESPNWHTFPAQKIKYGSEEKVNYFVGGKFSP